MENVGARYGIWSNIPNYGQVKDVGEVAMGTADMVSSLLQKHYKNRMDKYAAEEAARTLDSNVLRKNTENNITAKYFEPKTLGDLYHLQAQTGLLGAQAYENRARGNLYGRQGNLYDAEAARTKAQANLLTPNAEYDALLTAYEKEPNGSPRKFYLASQLNKMTAGGMPPAMGGRMPSGGMGGSTPGGMSIVPGGIGSGNMAVNPYTVSRQSAKGAQYFEASPTGKGGTVFNSPTQPINTMVQNKQLAETEQGFLSPQVNEGLAPYLSAWGSHVGFGKDLIKMKAGDKAAEERVNKAEEAMELLSEEVLIRLRMANPGMTIGEKMVNDQIGRMYPSLPPNYLRMMNKSENISKAQRRVDKLLKTAIDKGIIPTVANNFPAQVENTPGWAPQNSGGYFGGEGFIPPQLPQQPQASPPQNVGNAGQENDPLGIR